MLLDSSRFRKVTLWHSLAGGWRGAHHDARELHGKALQTNKTEQGKNASTLPLKLHIKPPEKAELARDGLVRAAGEHRAAGCSGGNVTGAAGSSGAPRPRAVPAAAAPPSPRARGRGRRVEPAHPRPHSPRSPPARRQAPVSLPLPRAELPRGTVRPLSECALGGEVPPTCVCPVPPGAPHKGDLGSGGQPAADRPGASGGAGTREDPLRAPPAGAGPCPRLGSSGSAAAPHPAAGWRGPAQTHGALPRGVPSPRLHKRRPGRARGGRYPDGQSGGGEVPAAPPPRARLRSPVGRPPRQRRVT